MVRRHYLPVFVFLIPFLFTPQAALAVMTAEAPGAAFVAPAEDETQQTSALQDPVLVPEVLHLPSAATAAAATLQALRDQTAGPGVPYQNGFARSGTEQRVKIDVATATFAGERTGELRHDDGTGTSWLGRFVVEDAYAFRVQLRDLELPKGARIWVHSGETRQGPNGRELLDPEGNLWLPPAPGPEVVVEIELAADSPESSELSFVVGTVMELIDTPEAGLDPQVWTDCDIDAMCVSTSTLSIIDMLREATARLSFVKGAGSYLCSGGLLNDTDGSGFRPFLLTANHCFDTQASASSLVAYFDYRTNSCNGTAPSLGSVPSVSGATLLASNAVSDFTFVELSGNPTGTTWYLGWTTADPSSGQSMYRVSHPQGTTQKYSAASFTGSSGINCSGLPTSDFHYSAGTTGSTAGGSSGSPATQNYSGDARVVGQLYGVCHFSSWDDCNYSTYNYIDGAFSTTFPYIESWLDPDTPCADSYEPDDSSGAASPISPGSPQSHSICPAGDEDWMTFTIATESAVTLETSGPSGDTRMWLYDSGLTQLEFDDDAGTSLFSFIDRVCGVDALPAGTYYVKVDEFGDDDEIADYQIAYNQTQSCGGSCSANLTLSNTVLSGTQSFRADNTITLGPSLVVDGTLIDMIAGQTIVITDGTEIGGSFSAGTDPNACSL